MSTPPNKNLHEDGNTSNVNHCHLSAIKYPNDDQGSYTSAGGKVATSIRHDYHIPYDISQDNRLPKVAQRTESRETDRRSPLLPNVLFRVSTSNDSHSERVDSENRIESRDSKENIKYTMPDNRDIKAESRESQQNTKCDKNDSRSDDIKDIKNEKDTSVDHNIDPNLAKDGYYGSNSHLIWKDLKEHRPKQYSYVTGGNADSWTISSRTSSHGPSDTSKDASKVEKDHTEDHEAVGENKVAMKVDDKSKDRDRKRKEVKQRDWGERDRERTDRRLNLQPANSIVETKEPVRDDKVSERWGSDKNDIVKEMEKLNEKEQDRVKGELFNGSDKEASQTEKETTDIPGKSENLDISSSELTKEHDSLKSSEREPGVRKKDRDTDVELERPEKRGKYEEGCIDADFGTERDKEVFNCGVQQRKRMLRPRGSPQAGHRDPRFRPRANDNEGSNGKADMSCVVYKIGECMQELLKLWKEYESSLTDKACEGPRSGPTLEIRISAEHVTATNRQVRGGQLWGTDVYTVDSDLVAVLMHTGYCRPTASPPPSAAQELRATIRVLPPQDCYVSTLRNNVRSRAWGAAIGCSYCVERCFIVKRGGGIIELEPCLTHSSSMEPTLAPVAVERTMTTRAAASNALRQQRFVREVTIQFNLCMEPWLKYSISAVADKGLKKVLFTSSRLKKGEVLYLETHFHRYELCFNGEKAVKVTTSAGGTETEKIQTSNSNLANGDKNTSDGESTLADMFRWSRCKRPLPQKMMQNIGIPLSSEYLEILEENIEWDDILWSQTGVWICGKEYHLARAHFLSPI